MRKYNVNGTIALSLSVAALVLASFLSSAYADAPNALYVYNHKKYGQKTGDMSGYQSALNAFTAADRPRILKEVEALEMADAIKENALKSNVPQTVQSTGVDVMPMQQQAPAVVAAPSLTGKDYLAPSFKQTTARGNYQGYEYLIQNKQPYHLELLQAEVVNGVEESYVAQEENQKKQNRRSLFGGLLNAASYIPYAAGGYGSYGGWGAYHAANTVGNAAINASTSGSYNMTNKYLTRLNGVIINPNQTYQFLTLTPKGTSPRIRMTFKNLETNQIFDLEQ